MVADDIGVDMIGVYALGDTIDENDRLQSPVIDGLVDVGVQFQNAWVYPFCSPTRVAIRTGRDAHRTGVGRQIVNELSDFGLNDSAERILPELLSGALGSSIACACFGKWHMSAPDGVNPNPTRPVLAGYGRFEGTVFPWEADYCAWTKIIHEAGSPPTSSTSNAFLPLEEMDSCLQWLQGLPQGQSWFAYLPVQAPFELPIEPDDLDYYSDYFPELSGTVCAVPPTTTGKRRAYQALIESIDLKLGEILSWIDADAIDQGYAGWEQNTTVVFIGDNGTFVLRDAEEYEYWRQINPSGPTIERLYHLPDESANLLPLPLNDPGADNLTALRAALNGLLAP